MAMRDQERAVLAFTHVEAYLKKETKSQKKYATIVHKMPSLLQSAGLCQALHFAKSRPDEEQRGYVDQLAAQLSRCLGTKAPLTGDQLLDRVRRAGIGEYCLSTT